MYTHFHQYCSLIERIFTTYSIKRHHFCQHSTIHIIAVILNQPSFFISSSKYLLIPRKKCEVPDCNFTNHSHFQSAAMWNMFPLRFHSSRSWSIEDSVWDKSRSRFQKKSNSKSTHTIMRYIKTYLGFSPWSAFAKLVCWYEQKYQEGLVLYTGQSNIETIIQREIEVGKVGTYKFVLK